MIAIMSTSSSSRLKAVAPLSAPPGPASLPAAFAEQLSDLYQLVQRSSHVFGSPLGPIHLPARELHLARFVYFGPHTSDASLRLAFYAGFDHRDLRSTLALLHVVEGLALKPDLGQGLNLSFFPLVDLLGLAGLAPSRDLAAENWARSAAPELGLLERDARRVGYHGFIRLTLTPHQDLVTVRLRAPAHVENPAPPLELISSDDTEPFPVRWESDAPSAAVSDGPLTIADDLPQQPFELTLSLPSAWSTELVREAAASILKRFVLRYRGFIAYGQHL